MQYEFFDKQAFEKEVMEDVKSAYTVVNKCTILYEALAKVEGVAAQWQFANNRAEKDCWQYILVLANRCFSEIWGLKDNNGQYLEQGAEEFAELHLNDTSGAPKAEQQWQRCHWPGLTFKARMLGMPFYRSLLDLRHVKRKAGKQTPIKAEAIVRAITTDEKIKDVEIKNALITMVQALYPD
jgi:hypothetical protein